MPMNMRHRLTGILNWHADQKIYLIHIAGGRPWRLDLSDITLDPQCLGEVVVADGIRTGFAVVRVSALRRLRPEELF